MSEETCGLSQKEVNERVHKYGVNELLSQRRQGAAKMLFNILKEPMLFLLLIAGTVYFFLGEMQDAMMLMALVLVVIGITFYQERKTEKALEALRDLSSPRALVIRDGAQMMIAGKDVVPDDIVILHEGMRIPADGVVITSSNLCVDESLLTGESVPVRKCDGYDGQKRYGQIGGDDTPFVYSGTMVTQGHATIRITSIGSETEIGRIGVSLGTISEEEMLLKKETRSLVQKFAIAGVVLCLGILMIYGFFYDDWVKGILSGLSLSMAMLPEEFSVVLAVFLAIGAWRMSRHRVLTRHAAAIETLGAATVLCVDKTGTITENQMFLTHVMVRDRIFALEDGAMNERDSCRKLISHAILASQEKSFDPIERAIRSNTVNITSREQSNYADWSLLREFPMSVEMLALSHVWISPDERACIAAAKGAPEAIADLCHMDDAQREKLMQHVQEMSDKGLRILGVAYADVTCPDTANVQHDYAFRFTGLLGFMDPVRDTVQRSVAECYEAGMRVIMITGDYPGTAQSIARKIGLRNPQQYITGAELSEYDREQLCTRIAKVNIFSRVVPEQKLLIIDALKANGEIVVMTGDGVNDAPALKSAHVGVAMGARGTDVAREAADIVLLDDNFSSIVSAVRMGRRVFDNLKKAIAYIFAVHIPIAGLALIPVFLHWPVVLFPAHIAFLELIIDPACSIVYESEKAERGIMRRRPRSLRESLLDRTSFFTSLFLGLGVLTVVLVMYSFALRWGFSEEKIRAITFVTLVSGNVALIVTNLSHCHNLVQIIREGNIALWIVMGCTIVGLIALVYVPFLRELFHFEVLSAGEFLLGCGVAVVSVMWFEIYKMMHYGNMCGSRNKG